jgi:transposase
MKQALLEWSKEQLVGEVLELRTLLARVPELEKQVARIADLEFQLAQLKRMIFGSKSERFIPSVPDEQLALDLGLEPGSQEPPETEEVHYTRIKNKPKEKPFRQPLPNHLPRTEILIEPEGDLTGLKKIGEEIKEVLEYTPASLFVTRYVRPKYVDPTREENGVQTGNLPALPLPKAIAAASLLAIILVDKYVDHLPYYRQIQRFKRIGMRISKSTINGWIKGVCELLSPLYDLLVERVLQSQYIMADETTMKVLEYNRKEKNKKDKRDKKVTLGYQWVYYAHLRKLVLFDYQPGRSAEGPRQLLKSFKGFLQSDGYKVYDGYEHVPGITLLNCMAHARRKFEEALDYDPKRAEYVLVKMQGLYEVEREAKEKEFSHPKRKALRLEKSAPILTELQDWLKLNLSQTLPESPIGKAIRYSHKRWDKLGTYTQDGRLEIDNNFVENALRPIALGRKNYLFAGSHEGAKRAAMIYSFFATCKKNDIDCFKWLKDVLNRIQEHPINRLEELLPNNWKPLPQDKEE